MNMNWSRIVLLAALTAMIGFFGGYFFYAQTVARYETISSVCVAVQQAVQRNMLSIEQVRELGSSAGSVLKRDYGSVAGKLRIPQEGADQVSADSICSQFLLGVHHAP